MKKSNIRVILVLLAFVFLLTMTGCKKKYELEFITNGGENISTETVKNKTEYTLPVLSREGYIFEGWYTNSDFSGDAITSVTVTNNTKVYAKWLELCKMTLDLDGGTCSTTVVYGKEGEQISSLLKGLTPSKNGVTFGGWFINDVELKENDKLTSKDVTVKAKYKVKYTIEVYKQNQNLDGYDKEIITDYDFVGKLLIANQTYNGFTSVEKNDTVGSVELNENEANNLMRVYYDRNVFVLEFYPNYPTAEFDNSKISVEGIYGQEIDLPTIENICKGYYLLGWSTSPDGKVMYPVHFMENLVVNKDKDVEFEEVKVNAENNMTLYAVWNKGYTDMFGGSDYIFVDKEADIVYLSRGNAYFVGQYSGKNTFIFYNESDNLTGKIFDDGTFAYSNAERAEYSASLYQVGKGINEDVKVLFDEYNGITYSEKIKTWNNETFEFDTKIEFSRGSYIIDENGYFIATFNDGLHAGETLTFVFGTVKIEDSTVNAFQLRNVDEFELGELVKFVVYNGEITYYTSAYQIMLTGFGTAVYNTGTSVATYTYTYDKETRQLVLRNSSTGRLFGTYRVMTVDGKNGYMDYNESAAVTYNGENGETLELDGLYIAIYTDKDGNVAIGNYEMTASAFGGKIVTFTYNGNKYVFLTNSYTEDITLDDVTTSETINEFTKKNPEYAEYYYKDEESIYYAPLVVIDDVEPGYASIYGYTSSKTFELVLEGTYTIDEITHLYTFTTTKSYEKEVSTAIVDYAKVNSILFALDSSTTNYSINYWYSITIDGEVTTYGVEYTSDGVSLKLVAGIAVIEYDGSQVIGTYTVKDGLATISTRGGSLYLEIDEENKTFILLAYKPFNAYVAMEDGTYSQREYIYFDGKGNATYVYYVLEMVGEGEEAKEDYVMYTISGTVKALNKVIHEELYTNGIQVYEFVSDEKTFEFIQLTISQNAVILPYYGGYYGTYTSEEDGILTLDGYAFYATYTDKQGQEYTGIYTIDSENVIKILLDNTTMYFDLTNRTFTLRGKEFATYIVMYNQGTTGIYVELDGYGNAVVYKLEVDENGESVKVVIDEKAPYTQENGLFSIVYKENNTEVTLEGRLSTYTYSQVVFNTFVIENNRVVTLYLNEKDWSILKLDSIGNATKIDKNGIEEKGTYMIITDSILYYVNNDSTNANIFKYDVDNGRIIEEKFIPRGYYTEDLKSLLFSQYGFAIFNNETRYYYTMDGDDVLIYHQDSENPNANAYGFVEDNFGKFDEVKEFDGETYYANDGYAIIFTRKDETSSFYPVLVKIDEEGNEIYAAVEELIFTPSGSDTFRVSGTVRIDGVNYPCTVVRELVDDAYVMYFTIGYYRFDFTAKFTGKNAAGETDSKYEITALSYQRPFYPYSYLDMYYLLYSFLGPTYANSYTNQLGMFYIKASYDTEGKEIESYLTIDFYEGSNAFDLNGKLLSNEKVTDYIEDSGSYTVELVGTDGYTYRLYFSLQLHRSFGMYAYQISALTRVETVTDGEYTLTIERIIITDNNYAPGTIWLTELVKGEEVIETKEKYLIDGVLHYVVRTKEDDKITSTKYYKLDLVTRDSSFPEEDSKVVQPYESLKVTVLEADTYYDAEKSTYFDVVDGKVILLSIKGYNYAIKTSEYDETTKTYTITLTSGTQYKLTIDEENVATVTKVVVTEEQQSNSEEAK